MRMAWQAGRLDVDRMLEELTPQQLTEWQAALEVVGIDDSWQQAGTICQQLHFVAERFNSEPSSDRLPTPKDFMPLLRQREQPSTPKINVMSQEDIGRAIQRWAQR